MIPIKKKKNILRKKNKKISVRSEMWSNVLTAYLETVCVILIDEKTPVTAGLEPAFFRIKFFDAIPCADQHLLSRNCK